MYVSNIKEIRFWFISHHSPDWASFFISVLKHPTYYFVWKYSLLWGIYPTVVFIALFEESCSLRANPHSRRAAAAQFHSFKQLCTRCTVSFILLKNEWGASHDQRLFPSILILCCRFLLPASLLPGRDNSKRQATDYIGLRGHIFVWAN